MAASGRKPKPVEIRRLEGNPGHNPIPNIPKAKPMPENFKPPWLSGFAIEEWDNVAPELMRLGIITKLNYTMLGIYCELIGDIKRRLVSADENERARAFSLMREARMFANEFGLTPASISRIAVTNNNDQNDEFGGLLD